MDKIDLDSKLLEEVNKAEKDYKEYKHELALLKADFALKIDWNKVNANRLNQGKPKITNEANRKNYFLVHFADEDKKLLQLELKYRSLEREFEKVLLL